MKKLATTIIALSQLISLPAQASAFSDVYFDDSSVAYNGKVWYNCADGYSNEKYTGWRTLHNLREKSYHAPDMLYYAYCNKGAYEVYDVDITIDYSDGGVSLNQFGEIMWHGTSKQQTIDGVVVVHTLHNRSRIYTGEGVKGVVTFSAGSSKIEMEYNIAWGERKNCSDSVGAVKHHMADAHILIGKSKGTTFDGNGCKNKQSIAVNIGHSGALRLADDNNLCLTQSGPNAVFTQCSKDEYASPTQQMVHDTYNKQLVIAYGLDFCLTALNDEQVGFAQCSIARENASWTFSHNKYESHAYPGKCLTTQFGQAALAACETLTHNNGHWDFSRP